jgi:flagellar FliL protein
MAEAAPAESTPAPKGKMPLLIGIAAAVLLAGGGGAYFLLGKKAGAAPAEEAPAEVHKAASLFVALEPPFVVNFERGAAARFLQITVQLMTRDPLMVEFLKSHDPIIRNDLLLLFAGQKVDEVATREGREALRESALQAVRKVIEAEHEKPESLEAVYFTSFVMQ